MAPFSAAVSRSPRGRSGAGRADAGPDHTWFRWEREAVTENTTYRGHSRRRPAADPVGRVPASRLPIPARTASSLPCRCRGRRMAPTRSEFSLCRLQPWGGRRGDAAYLQRDGPWAKQQVQAACSRQAARTETRGGPDERRMI